MQIDDSHYIPTWKLFANATTYGWWTFYLTIVRSVVYSLAMVIRFFASQKTSSLVSAKIEEQWWHGHQYCPRHPNIHANEGRWYWCTVCNQFVKITVAFRISILRVPTYVGGTTEWYVNRIGDDWPEPHLHGQPLGHVGERAPGRGHLCTHALGESTIDMAWSAVHRHPLCPTWRPLHQRLACQRCRSTRLTCLWVSDSLLYSFTSVNTITYLFV